MEEGSGLPEHSHEKLARLTQLQIFSKILLKIAKQA